MSKKAFTDAMKVLPREHIIFFCKECVLKWVEDHLPGLPEEISLQIFKIKYPDMEKYQKMIS